MYRIICPECKNNNDFESADNRPAECSYCFCLFDNATPAIEIDTPQRGIVAGIKLIYQKTSAEIRVESDYELLGRDNFGSELLRKILYAGAPVISRKHCSFTLINGDYWLKDEGSSNGTYLGIDKQSCSVPQKLSDGAIVYLGREMFLVKLMYENLPESMPEAQPVPEIVNIDEAMPTTELPEVMPGNKKYRCNEGCGFETETYVEMCPNCYTCGSLVEISS